MPYEDNEENSIPFTDSAEDSTEIVSSPAIINSDDLTNEQIANRIILQLQYNEDCQRERDEKICELLEKLCNDSVSENDVDSAEVETKKSDNSSEVFRLVEAPAAVDDDAILSSLSDIYGEIVSQNTIINESIMDKDLSGYNTSEGISFFIALCVLCLLLFVVWKRE